MKNPAFILIAILSLFFSCKKDVAITEEEVPATPSAPAPPPSILDTVKPLSYFPAYPGSSWNYSDNTVKNTSATYVKDVHTIILSPTTLIKSDTFLVPKYDGALIWGYRTHDETSVGGKSFVRIISDSLPLGSEWLILRSSHTVKLVKIIAINSSVIISGQTYSPTIVLYHYTTLDAPGFKEYSRAKHYYTRDIGLVKSEFLSDSDSSVVTKEVHLTNYFINK